MIIRDNKEEQITVYELPLENGTFVIKRQSKIINNESVVILSKYEIKNIKEFVGD